MTNKFIELHLGSHVIIHGFDAENKEISERVEAEEFSKKIVAISRIKSVSEKFILTDYTDGRLIYWEYQDDYKTIKKVLTK
ncbi:hypothetical protein [Formosa sp. PL04]|uniref:hypothetical protein n=1 Tax=Formosa sp. PL04 TaxID=3081755 RepID=UPI0029810A7F|nr:hypothetical protein [Formosa sp. PL04]MDW5287459.1 hypothetical protein [Formosa sp. PL04]